MDLQGVHGPIEMYTAGTVKIQIFGFWIGWLCNTYISTRKWLFKKEGFVICFTFLTVVKYGFVKCPLYIVRAQISFSTGVRICLVSFLHSDCLKFHHSMNCLLCTLKLMQILVLYFKLFFIFGYVWYFCQPIKYFVLLMWVWVAREWFGHITWPRDNL